MTGRRILNWSAAAAMGVGAWMALTAPPDALQGIYARVLYVHVPAGWLAYLAFGLALVGSIGWLVSKRRSFDRLAVSSVEIGVFFTGLTIITGMIWGYPVWGVAWDWGDARLMSVAVMFFVYLAYLALRRTIDDPDVRATRSAAVGVAAFVIVPLSYFSTILWRTLHQGMTFTPSGINMDPAMLPAFFVNLGAFTLLFVAFLVSRLRIARYEERVAATDARTAGAGIAPPDLGLIDG